MSRKKTTKESIRNPEHYFNRFIALEIQRDKRKQTEISNMELSLEENSLNISITYQCATNTAHEDFDAITLGDARLAWIETIKDERLYNAMQQLDLEQKLILVMYFHDGHTQQEIAELLQVSQVNISKRIMKIYEQIVKMYE